MEENRKYTTIADLLEDDDFIFSVNHPSPESEAYWSLLRKEGLVKEDDYELACYCVRSFRPSGKALTKEEAANLLANVRMKTARMESDGRRRINRWLSVVAACLVILIGFFFFRLLTREKQAPTAAYLLQIEEVARPENTDNDIMIVFSDDMQMALKEKKAEITYNEKGEVEINSHAVSPSTKSSAETHRDTYNQVIIPKGRHILLTLSDGTKLWMNASSRVVYPPVFDDKKREIYLEGEAYLEVSPKANQPFIVKTKQMEVNVLGTSFNVSAYEDEASQTVVLVTGAVSIKTKRQTEGSTKLKPNQLFQLSSKETRISEVEVDNYISWKDGIYIYKDEALSLILKRLAHYYGVVIQFAPEVGLMTFTGKLDLKNDAERVLNGLSNTAPIHCRKENETFYLYMDP
ncbi:MAG: FecR domain-containing protein [Tannerellaceae bacterium]|jgi:hypothetical protein|nr:FecR domain-containing protein [Tannerellaceae bacterium]